MSPFLRGTEGRNEGTEREFLAEVKVRRIDTGRGALYCSLSARRVCGAGQLIKTFSFN